MLTIVEDGLTFAKGMPLLLKLKKQFSQEIVEQVIQQCAVKGEVIRLDKLWAVFNQRCKEALARPVVAKQGPAEYSARGQAASLPAENQRGMEGYLNG